MAAGFLSKHFEDVNVGDAFVSRGRTVTEADIVNWCALTGDWHVLHSDAHYAAGSRFGQRIAPGILVYALAAGLGVPADTTTVIANCGADDLRFLAPTVIGDTLHLEARVREKKLRSSGGDGIVVIAWNMINQHGVTVMTSNLRILLSCARVS
jgi:3-hydroxybutyryl-CoA dehydratase